MGKRLEYVHSRRFSLGSKYFNQYRRTVCVVVHNEKSCINLNDNIVVSINIGKRTLKSINIGKRTLNSIKIGGWCRIFGRQASISRECIYRFSKFSTPRTSLSSVFAAIKGARQQITFAEVAIVDKFRCEFADNSLQFLSLANLGQGQHPLDI